MIEIKGIDQLINALNAVGAKPDPKYKRTCTLEPHAKVVIDRNGNKRIVHWSEMRPFPDARHHHRP
jgi:hypothetical protein